MPIEQRDDHHIDANRFARPGGSCDKQMRHPRQINHHQRAGNVLTKCHWQVALVLLPNAMVKNFAEQDRLPVLIRQFNANDILPWDNGHAN